MEAVYEVAIVGAGKFIYPKYYKQLKGTAHQWIWAAK